MRGREFVNRRARREVAASGRSILAYSVSPLTWIIQEENEPLINADERR